MHVNEGFLRRKDAEERIALRHFLNRKSEPGTPIVLPV